MKRRASSGVQSMSTEIFTNRSPALQGLCFSRGGVASQHRAYGSDDLEQCPRLERGEQRDHCFTWNSDAAFGDIALAQVEEDCTPLPSNRGRVVVTEHYDRVVETVLAPQPLGRIGVRVAHRAIVLRIARVVRPAVIGAQPAPGEMSGRR